MTTRAPGTGRRYLELVGGPLDGVLLDIIGWTQDEVDTGVALATEQGQFGAGGWAMYDPRPGDPRRFEPTHRQQRVRDAWLYG
ncbi:hypothetical protein GCM10010252_56560 [Streptomyces aureoverticillatus]|nr:hypothetical protein GCM10010252_56560 [Streptomyces aureoverticillatus]